MIAGLVDEDGVPTISLEVEGTVYRAVVDTGFNGGLELPMELKETVNAHPIGERWAELAAGQRILEELFRVSFPFDGRIITTEASFLEDIDDILIGTALLSNYRLVIDFPQASVMLERTVESNGTAN